jgi:hypothetical protein
MVKRAPNGRNQEGGVVMGIYKHIETVLGQPHIYNYDLEEGFILYNPVKPFEDKHGTVVAQLMQLETQEGQVEITNYYSRAWCYWNFIDSTHFELKEADELVALEAQMMPEGMIDGTISDAERVLLWLDHGYIPTESEFWQRLVVSLAYNAITDTNFFEDLADYTWHSAASIQKMLDLAAGAVLQHPNFQLTGFQHISPK